MPEPIFMKLGMYIKAPEPISTAYFINPSHQSVPLYVYPPIVTRQRFGEFYPSVVDRQRQVKSFASATNTHAIIEELLEV
jgi:hypothetical protein